MAHEIGHAEGLALDLAASDFGLGRRPVTVVAVFPKEDTRAELHFAQARGVPYTGISGGVDEIGSGVAAYMQRARVARRCLASNGSWVPYPPAHGTHEWLFLSTMSWSDCFWIAVRRSQPGSTGKRRHATSPGVTASTRS
jgi:hypothetical protein